MRLRNEVAEHPHPHAATGTDGRPQSDDAAEEVQALRLDHEAQALWLAAGGFSALLALVLLASGAPASGRPSRPEGIRRSGPWDDPAPAPRRRASSEPTAIGTVAALPRGSCFAFAVLAADADRTRARPRAQSRLCARRAPVVLSAGRRGCPAPRRVGRPLHRCRRGQRIVIWNREQAVRRRRRSHARACRRTAVSGVRLALTAGQGGRTMAGFRWVGGLLGAIGRVAVVAVVDVHGQPGSPVFDASAVRAELGLPNELRHSSPRAYPGGPLDQRRRRGRR